MTVTLKDISPDTIGDSEALAELGNGRVGVVKAVVPIDKAGNELLTAGSPGHVQGNITATVGSIATVAEVTNVPSVDLIDAVTEVANVTSVDLVDRVTLLDLITRIAEVTLVGQVSEIVQALPAGENYLGMSGLDGKTFATALTVTLPAYVSGDCVGGIQQLSSVARVSGGRVTLNTLTLWDVAGQEEAYNVYLFRSNPSSSTFIDADPVVLHGDDVSKLVPGCPFRLYTGDYLAAQSGGSGASRVGMGVSFDVIGTDVWVALEAVETPDYTATSDLTLLTDFLRD